MAQIVWTLEQLLEAKDLTMSKLAKKMGGDAEAWLTTLYQRPNPQRVDLAVMAEVIAALRELTGEDVGPNELLTFVPDPEPMDDETRAWLESDLGGLDRHEPYDWGSEGPPEGEPVHYVAGKGLFVDDDPE